MNWTSHLNGSSGRLIAWLLVGLWLTLVLLLSGCGTPRPPSPPVLFQPAKIQPPDSALMTPPKDSGRYLESARESLSGWQTRLSNLQPKSEGSKPTQTAP